MHFARVTSDPMTYMYKLDPYYVLMCGLCKYELPTSRLLKVLKSVSCRTVFSRVLFVCIELQI